MGPVTGRHKSGEATRERLLTAATDLLYREGPAALTTARLAREARIVQSGFYTHFASVDQLMLEATGRIGARLRRLIQQGLARLRAQGGGGVAELRALFELVLQWVAEERVFITLVLRHRRDASAVGAAFAALVAQFHADLATHLLLLWGPEQTHADAAWRAQVDLHATLILGAFLAALESYVDRPDQPTGPLTEALARHGIAAVEDLFSPVAGTSHRAS